MSLKRQIWNDGMGATVPDLQSVSDTAAGADDRVLESILTPDPQTKRILPMRPESTTFNPNLLAQPSPAVNGCIRVYEALYIASPGTGLTVTMSKLVQSIIDSLQIASNSSGSTRYDAFYVVMQRQVTVTGTRKLKRTVDGEVVTGTVNLADAPVVSLVKLQGVASGNPFATMPADTATAFCFPICMVTVANGYTLGTALTQSQITQYWQGHFVPRNRVQGLVPGSIFTDGITQSPSTPIAQQRWGAGIRLAVVVKQTGSGSFVIDQSIDWRKRMIWGVGVRAKKTGGVPYYPAPELVTAAGADVGFRIDPGLTGTDNANACSVTITSTNNFNGGAASTQTITLSADANGKLKLGFSTGPFDTNDYYTLVLEATDRFEF